MSFEYLQSFLAVAEHGSFFSAAVALGQSRTTLRRHVEALEASTGVALLRRSRDGVVLTEAGKRLVGGGHEMERDYSALLSAVGEIGRRPEGEVRILAQSGLPPAAIVAAYGLSRVTWQGLYISLWFSDEPLKEDLSNVDIVNWFGAGDPGATWSTTKLITMPVQLYASEAYLSEHEAPASIADLKKHDVLAWIALGERAPKIVTRKGEAVPIQPLVSTTNVDLLHEFARWGHGIVWMPDGGIPFLPGQAPLFPVLEQLVGTTLSLHTATPKALAGVPKFQIILSGIEVTRTVAESLNESLVRPPTR